MYATQETKKQSLRELSDSVQYEMSVVRNFETSVQKIREFFACTT